MAQENDPGPDGRARGAKHLAFVVILAEATGLISLGAAWFAVLVREWQAMGICLLASAIVFGSLANAFART